jgi:hypothetical protein
MYSKMGIVKITFLRTEHPPVPGASTQPVAA